MEQVAPKLSILITQCLQVDYFIPGISSTPYVFVGEESAVKLIGNDEDSPLKSFINWTRKEKNLEVLFFIQSLFSPN